MGTSTELFVGLLAPGHTSCYDLLVSGITRDVGPLVVLIVVGTDVDVESPGGDQLRSTFQAYTEACGNRGRT